MILIYAFKPFLLGKLHNGNASRDVLEAIRAVEPSRFRYLLITADPDGMQKLVDELQSVKPRGILGMGQGGRLLSVNVEPDASNGKSSPFVLANFDGTESHIGDYYCGVSYSWALDWASLHGDVPTAFVHIPMVGSRVSQTAEVRKVLDKLVQEVSRRG